MVSQVERLARVEEQVKELKEKVDDLSVKMDKLLELRYKGAGAFWLASALLGTGIVTVALQAFHYIFGVR